MRRPALIPATSHINKRFGVDDIGKTLRFVENALAARDNDDVVTPRTSKPIQCTHGSLAEADCHFRYCARDLSRVDCLRLLGDHGAKKKLGNDAELFDETSRGGRTRTRDQGIMLTTSAFAASFKFVVWTVSSLYEFAVQSLHLQRLAFIRKPSKLGSGLA